MQNKLVGLTERQYRLLPILAAFYNLPSSTAAVRAAVDALVATCADHDPNFRTAVRLSDAKAETGVIPERLLPETVLA